MQLLIVLAALGSAVCEASAASQRRTRSLRRSGSNATGWAWSSSRGRVSYVGNRRCPCIGFDNIEGETLVVIAEGEEKASYPADLGATCGAWERENHPKCTQGDEVKPDWCEKSWCYVDPKHCDIPILPKKSDYQPKAKYQGLPLYYSYATCGSTDSWSRSVPEYGAPGCRCVGIDNSPGSTTVTIDGKEHDYPAEIGGECKAWDNKRHPDCDGSGDQPDFCKQKWCYVDPCSCSTKTPPTTSGYIPEATYQGRPVYYSYETCGAVNTYEKKVASSIKYSPFVWSDQVDNHKTTCVKQQSEEACKQLDTKCTWTGRSCLGKELAETCGWSKGENVALLAQQSGRSAASGLRPLLALAALAALLG